MKSWEQMSETERNEIVAEKVLGWVKREGEWYKNSQTDDEGPLKLLPFSTDDTCALIILRQFDTYQITKLFPGKYRTIIQSNKHSVIAPTFPESICRAALKVFNVEI